MAVEPRYRSDPDVEPPIAEPCRSDATPAWLEVVLAVAAFVALCVAVLSFAPSWESSLTVRIGRRSSR
jgi:hypothetical protein